MTDEEFNKIVERYVSELSLYTEEQEMNIILNLLRNVVFRHELDIILVLQSVLGVLGIDVMTREIEMQEYDPKKVN